MKTEANEPISPVVEHNNYQGNLIMEARFNGLTKREHFAAMAMQGFIASGATEEYSKDDIASLSVGAADALIKALNKEEQ